MADKYWISTSSTVWSLSSNWSLSSGGVGGAGKPTSGDNAIFDSGASVGCEIDEDVNVDNFSINFSYYVNTNNYTLNIDGDLYVNSPFIRGTSTFNIVGSYTGGNVDNSQTTSYVFSGSGTIPDNLNVSNLTISGTYTSPGGNLYIQDTLTVSGSLNAGVIYSYGPIIKTGNITCTLSFNWFADKNNNVTTGNYSNATITKIGGFEAGDSATHTYQNKNFTFSELDFIANSCDIIVNFINCNIVATSILSQSSSGTLTVNFENCNITCNLINLQNNTELNLTDTNIITNSLSLANTAEFYPDSSTIEISENIYVSGSAVFHQEQSHVILRNTSASLNLTVFEFYDLTVVGNYDFDENIFVYNDLTIDIGGKLICSSGDNLYVYGGLIVDGTIDFSNNSKVLLVGNHNDNFPHIVNFPLGFESLSGTVEVYFTSVETHHIFNQGVFAYAYNNSTLNLHLESNLIEISAQDMDKILEFTVESGSTINVNYQSTAVKFYGFDEQTIEFNGDVNLLEDLNSTGHFYSRDGYTVTDGIKLISSNNQMRFGNTVVYGYLETTNISFYDLTVQYGSVVSTTDYMEVENLILNNGCIIGSICEDPFTLDVNQNFTATNSYVPVTLPQNGDWTFNIGGDLNVQGKNFINRFQFGNTERLNLNVNGNIDVSVASFKNVTASPEIQAFCSIDNGGNSGIDFNNNFTLSISSNLDAVTGIDFSISMNGGIGEASLFLIYSSDSLNVTQETLFAKTIKDLSKLEDAQTFTINCLQQGHDYTVQAILFNFSSNEYFTSNTVSFITEFSSLPGYKCENNCGQIESIFGKYIYTNFLQPDGAWLPVVTTCQLYPPQRSKPSTTIRSNTNGNFHTVTGYPILYNHIHISGSAAKNLYDNSHYWDLITTKADSILYYNTEYFGKNGIIKNNNPNCIINCYFSILDLETYLLNSVNPSFSKLFLESMPPTSILRDLKGNSVKLFQVSSGLWTYTANTAYSGYGNYLVPFIKRNILDSDLVDGIYYDYGAQYKLSWINHTDPPRSPYAIDNDLDTYAESDAKLDGLYLSGLINILNSTLGYKNLITMGNAEFATNSLFLPHLNGIVVDDFCSEGTDADNWVPSMRSYMNYCNASISPKYTALLSSKSNENDFQFVRFTLCSALMGNGYYGYTGVYPSQTIRWYDEYSVNIQSGIAEQKVNFKGYLGLPIGEAANILDDTDLLLDNLSLGLEDTVAATKVWRRDFENGIVLLNPTDSNVMINLESNYKKILGYINPTFNDGSILNNITLSSQDGIVLLRI